MSNKEETKAKLVECGFEVCEKWRTDGNDESVWAVVNGLCSGAYGADPSTANLITANYNALHEAAEFNEVEVDTARGGALILECVNDEGEYQPDAFALLVEVREQLENYPLIFGAEDEYMDQCNEDAHEGFSDALGDEVRQMSEETALRYEDVGVDPQEALELVAAEDYMCETLEWHEEECWPTFDVDVQAVLLDIVTAIEKQHDAAAQADTRCDKTLEMFEKG
jgi:hypothetical protein